VYIIHQQKEIGLIFVKKPTGIPLLLQRRNRQGRAHIEVGQLTELLQHLHHLDMVWLGYGTTVW